MKKQKVLIVSALFLCLCSDKTVSADLSQCNGIWTNKTCSNQNLTSDKSREAHEVKKESPDKPKLTEAQEKESMIHEFIKEVYQARKEHKVTYSYLKVEIFCKSLSTSLLECNNALTKEKEILLKEIKLAQERKDDKDDNQATSNNKTNVVIINENNSDEDESDQNYLHRHSHHKEGPFQGYKSPFGK